MAHSAQLNINLDHIAEGLTLIIDARTNNTLFDCEDAVLHAEANYQLKEGCFYDYEFSEGEYHFGPSDYIQPHVRKIHTGRIAPNVYVGTLTLEIQKTGTENTVGKIQLEVQSVKSDYRTDYRTMLESITERCTELIMQIDSPVTQLIEPDFDTDNKTLYQRFSFVKSLIDSREFEEAVQKILSAPTTKWETENHRKDIRNVRKFSRIDVQQLVSSTNRTALPEEHFLRSIYGLNSVPLTIDSSRKTESTDTQENRFIKHALQEFLFFCESCAAKFDAFGRSKLEAKALSEKLSNLLNQSFFKSISRPSTLQLNSPVLQRKSGYREVLNAWMKYDLAAKLVWRGGDDVYATGKKDIATLYEYWLFFTLLDLLSEVFSIQPKEIQQLIGLDKKGISLNLKQGTAIALKGIYESAARRLHVQFSYNRSFGGGKIYPRGGSYTTTLRPDYTLSIWPADVSDQRIAEKTEQITHIHFDAKYKVNNFYELISTSKADELDVDENEKLNQEEAEEIKKGTFKNQDLLKMHAYKDAIRRTGGAYVLYPGVGKNDPFRGFHELIPGLGAFVIKPTKNENEKNALKDFIVKVVNNFIDRASQREHTASKVYDIHINPRADNEILHAPMPEFIDGKKLIPDETYVLVGYSRNNERTEWYDENKIYNFRMDDDAGSLILDVQIVNAKYLLLRRKGEESASDMYRIVSKGLKVYSKIQLEKLDYPPIGNLKDYYLVVEIEKVNPTDFGNVRWHFKELDAYKEIKTNNKNVYKRAGIPFAVTLSDLMKVKL